MIFTIIFPVLNEKLRLESGVTRTVSYLEKIGYEDYEIIIVDNGSEDETPDIAKELCRKYPKVSYERINIRGVGAAFRRGV
jgi:glycosyltransferase involved in cell wall biosynthesis